MKITPELEAQAYEFARWTYDWNESSFLEVSKLSVAPIADKMFEIETEVWSIVVKTGELQVVELVYELTEDELNQSHSPTCNTDRSRGDCIHVSATYLNLWSEAPNELGHVPKSVLVAAVDEIGKQRSDLVTERCFDDPVDHYVYHIPDFHPQVRKIVRKYCRAEAISRRRQDRESRGQNRGSAF